MSQPITDDHGNSNEVKEVLDFSQLPQANGWLKFSTIFQYQGSWFSSIILPNVISFQKKFQAQDQDIILASNPKSGTTWLKALLFSILNRGRFTPSDTPLLTSNPHQLVPYFELELFSENPTRDHHDLSTMSPPRLFATHIRYASLPGSIVENSKCRIVYICRNPLDFITSFWHFAVKIFPVDDESAPLSIKECVDKFCAGEHEAGPFWDHALGFWRASLKNPEKVLFLKYEEMLEDTVSHAKRIAEFVGFPFTDEEEKQGVIEGIVELCSFASLKELDVNKHGKPVIADLDNKIFFRKGQVGDWLNHLSPSMVESVMKVIHEKLCDSGLTFKFN